MYQNRQKWDMFLTYVPEYANIGAYPETENMNLDPAKPYNDLPKLPPEESRYNTVDVWKYESAARSAVAELKGIAHIIPNQAILVNAIALQEAQDSSEIENIITTQDRLYRAVTMKDDNNTPQTKEVINYREALFTGYAFIKDKGFITVNDIITLQEIIVRNNAGIRSMPGTSLRNDRTGEIIYTPPDDRRIIYSLIDNLMLYFNNDKDNSLIKLSITHYQFESIHPFYDGNGRTGRILNVLYLILKGHLDIPVLYLSRYIINNKDDYYRLLGEVTFKDNWEEWIIYILKGIELTSKDTVDKIIKIKSLLDETVVKVKETSGNIYSKELVELLFENPYCKIEHLVTKLGIERKAASRYLKNLEETGILHMKKIGRENIYINTELMKLLKV